MEGKWIDETEGKTERSGRLKGNSRDDEERSVRLSLSMRPTRLAVATRRSIDAATSDVASLPLPSLALSFSLMHLIPLHHPLSLRYARMELLRSRAVGCSRHGRGFKGGDRRREHLQLPISDAPAHVSSSSRVTPLPQENPRSRPCPFLSLFICYHHEKGRRREDTHPAISSRFVYKDQFRLIPLHLISIPVIRKEKILVLKIHLPKRWSILLYA